MVLFTCLQSCKRLLSDALAQILRVIYGVVLFKQANFTCDHDANLFQTYLGLNI